MDAMEDAVDDTVRRSDQFGAVVKGKRSKRLRMVAVAPATSASSAEISGSTTEEEEDMAHCLILLAQGRGLELGREANPKAGAGEEEEAGGVEKPAVGRKAGDYVYQCKTCSKCFPSFQALGGHRTSHKKPKISPKISLLGESSKAALAEDEAAAAAACSSIPKPTAAATAAPASSNYSSSKPRMHECSICGAEFASGQALGGHMRRHRPLTPAESHPEVKKDKSAFLLDLNLPAPHDDGSQEPSPNSPPPAPAPAVPFSFDTQQSLVFLVDCHY